MSIDRRKKYRQGLSPLYLPFYDKLCELMPDHWQPVQGLRTIKEQDDLYAQGRTTPGKIVTRARGGMSAHNWGCATDWTVFNGAGTPLWPDDDDEVYEEYAKMLDKLGLTWGGEWKSFKDVAHNELALTVSWTAIYSKYQKSGKESAERLIKLTMIV